jgi:hypothetical protein
MGVNVECDVAEQFQMTKFNKLLIYDTKHARDAFFSHFIERRSFSVPCRRPT